MYGIFRMGKTSLNSYRVNIDEKLSSDWNEPSVFKLYMEVYVSSICMTLNAFVQTVVSFVLKGYLFLKWTLYENNNRMYFMIGRERSEYSWQREIKVSVLFEQNMWDQK